MKECPFTDGTPCTEEACALWVIGDEVQSCAFLDVAYSLREMNATLDNNLSDGRR